MSFYALFNLQIYTLIIDSSYKPAKDENTVCNTRYLTNFYQQIKTSLCGVTCVIADGCGEGLEPTPGPSLYGGE
jgi:hypothetical protein